MDFLMPQPDAIGIAETKEICLRKYGRVVTDDEAKEILGRVMRYLFLMNNLPPCSSTDNMPENLMTTNPSPKNR